MRLCAALLAIGALPACRNEPCSIAACDIREDACQQDVADAVTCIRGGEPKTVPVRVVDAYEYIGEQADEAMQSEDADRDRRWYGGLALLGLVSPGLSPARATVESLDNVAAFYRHDDKRVTILDRGWPMDSGAMTALLAHEYVHAFQDAEHDLTKVFDEHGTTTDAVFGVAAMVEGEATLYETQLFASHLGHDIDDVDWRKGYAASRRLSREGITRSSDPYLKLRSDFVYAYGGTYVDAVWRDGGDDAVRALLRHPPVSTRQVLLGYGTKPPGGAPWSEPELDNEAVPVLDASFALVAWEHLGSYALWVLLARWGDVLEDSDPADTRAVRELRSDVLSVHDNGDGSAIITTWRLRFATEKGAEKVVTLLRREGLQIWSSERDAFIVAPYPEDTVLPNPSDWRWGPLPEPEPAMPDADSRSRRLAIIE